MFILRRSYKTGWYTLKMDDAIKGVISSVSERKGVKNISVSACYPTQLSGDKGYEVHVSYQEDLDETFGFPEDLDKVIFWDVNSFQLPFNIEEMAKETHAGIVITTPSIKDEYYDVGNILPQKLAELMRYASENGVQIVGITPSASSLSSSVISNYGMLSTNTMENGVISYLANHPSIKSFIIVSKEDMNKLSPYLIKGDDISWKDKQTAKNMLNGKVLKKN